MWEWISKHSPNADKQVQKILQQCDLLLTMPELGRARPEFGKRVRCLNHDKYLIYTPSSPKLFYSPCSGRADGLRRGVRGRLTAR
ncbi:MAG: hypothetical protein C4332_04695 [Meiothermus sp.]